MLLLATAAQQKMAGLTGLAIILMASQALAQLTVQQNKPCGEITCQLHDYCRPADSICSPCKTLCDPNHSNLQEKECQSQCQDYLHDIRYQSLRDNDTNKPQQPQEDVKLLHAEIERLRVISTVALIISLVLVCIVLGVGAIWIKKKNILPFLFKKDKKSMKKHDAARYVGETPISTIRLPKDATITLPSVTDVVRPTGGAPPTQYANLTTFRNPAPKKPPAPETPTSTNKSLPGMNRVPSEDSTYAYDNPALTPSPKSTKAPSAL